jgi:hypothetical protein
MSYLLIITLVALEFLSRTLDFLSKDVLKPSQGMQHASYTPTSWLTTRSKITGQLLWCHVRG